MKNSFKIRRISRIDKYMIKWYDINKWTLSGPYKFNTNQTTTVMKEKKHTIIGFRSAGLMGAFITCLVMVIGFVFGLSIDPATRISVGYAVPEMFQSAGFLAAIPMWSLFLVLPLAIFGLVYRIKLFKAQDRYNVIDFEADEFGLTGLAWIGMTLSGISAVVAFGPWAQGLFAHVAIGFAIPNILIFNLMGRFMKFNGLTGFILGRLPWIAGIVWLAFFWIKGYGVFPILSVWALIAVLLVVGLAVTSILPMIEAIAEMVKPSINRPINKRYSWDVPSSQRALYEDVEKRPYLYWVVEPKWSI